MTFCFPPFIFFFPSFRGKWRGNKKNIPEKKIKKDATGKLTLVCQRVDLMCDRQHPVSSNYWGGGNPKWTWSVDIIPMFNSLQGWPISQLARFVGGQKQFVIFPLNSCQHVSNPFQTISNNLRQKREKKSGKTTTTMNVPGLTCGW